VCGWCHRFLGVKEPFAQWGVTHGMCDRCRGCLTSGTLHHPPEPRPLLVLSRDVPPVGGHLALPARVYLEPTTVVWDRRQADRRRDPRPGMPERRQHERRVAAASLWTRGFVVLPPAAQSSARQIEASISA
jgi:hypothetical protein